MEQTALRPKSMPGAPRREAPAVRGNGSGGRRPHAARRRGKRLVTLLFGLLVGVVLVLSGVGLGTVGATVIGMSKLAEVQQHMGVAPRPPSPAPSVAPTGLPSPSARPLRATLGVEAVDAPNGAGALVVGVHVPGPGYTAGLVRGDVLVAVDGTRIDSAAGLARAVEAARAGRAVTLTVRHMSGAHQVLSATPGVVV
ncbi:PDZ domain-containing protein [Streptomyces antnestii]|uniref:PDZ domain-containing protein n=1 Tax=Streptomyces antnestii TaxID=2494256 RepID=A0A3S2VJ19_9ACTN|nr:PDZ domain-containing protein [Streptomyces sp. San01]RVU28537.1 PDZ domain-containing protein [Streptomyces sp. San01]